MMAPCEGCCRLRSSQNSTWCTSATTKGVDDGTSLLGRSPRVRSSLRRQRGVVCLQCSDLVSRHFVQCPLLDRDGQGVAGGPDVSRVAVIFGADLMYTRRQVQCVERVGAGGLSHCP